MPEKPGVFGCVNGGVSSIFLKVSTTQTNYMVEK